MQNWRVFVVGLMLLSGSAFATREELSLPNGDRYKGDVVDGVLNGTGTYIWADGDRYEGEFANDLPNGEGRYLWSDGRRYTGEFSDGKRQGRGLLIWGNGDRYEGEFRANQIHGEGTLAWANGDRYEGGFQSNQRSGMGLMQWRSGQRYAGNFEQGTMEGQGTYDWPDGSRYSGEFEADLRTGLGIFLSPGTDVFSGTFIDGSPEGLGVRKTSASTSYFEQWRNGVLSDSRQIEENSRCGFSDEYGAWMVLANDCINGIAHGAGVAVTLDGRYVLSQGQWVLGNRLKGKLIELVALPETDNTNETRDQLSALTADSEGD